MNLKIFNTLSKKLDFFNPLNDTVKVYACVLMGWKFSSFKNNIHKYGSAYHGGKGKET